MQYEKIGAGTQLLTNGNEYTLNNAHAIVCSGRGLTHVCGIGAWLKATVHGVDLPRLSAVNVSRGRMAGEEGVSIADAERIVESNLSQIIERFHETRKTTCTSTELAATTSVKHCTSRYSHSLNGLGILVSMCLPQGCVLLNSCRDVREGDGGQGCDVYFEH